MRNGGGGHRRHVHAANRHGADKRSIVSVAAVLFRPVDAWKAKLIAVAIASGVIQRKTPERLNNNGTRAPGSAADIRSGDPLTSRHMHVH